MTSEPKSILLLTFDSNTQDTKKKVEFLNYVYMVKGIYCHSNHFPQLFELKKKKATNKKNKSHYLNVYFVILVVTHNIFTQLNIPTQDLPSCVV